MKKTFLLVFLTALLESGLFAVEVDFILDQGNKSYRKLFSNQAAISYMDGYMSQFKANMHGNK